MTPQSTSQNAIVLNQHSLAGQSFGYSAADFGDLSSTEYTLVTIVVDESSSVRSYKTDMEKCIQEIVKSCQSPRCSRSDYLLIRIVAFKNQMREIHGFKRVVDCDLNEYDDCLQTYGSTMFFRTAVNAIDATNNYGTQLVDSEDCDVNAIIFFITDGEDNESGRVNSDNIKNSLQQVMKDEKLESILSILIGIGIPPNSNLNSYLQGIKNDGGIDQYESVENADADTLARIQNFVSQSISSQSNQLNTGGPSLLLNF